MRSAKKTEEFPYTSNTICYFEVYKDGKVSRLYHKNKEGGQTYMAMVEAICRAEKGESTIYAVWPGNWSSDLFIIDDLELFNQKMTDKLL